MFKFEIDEQLYLKLLSVREAEDLFEIVDANRSYLAQWLPWVPKIKEVSDSKSFIQSTREQFTEDNGWQAGIWYQNQLVGVIGYHRVNWQNQKTTIGYWLDQKYQGKGIMTSCCREIVNYAFKEWELNKVEIRCAEENKKSRAIPERLGFVQEGKVREAELLADGFVDHIVYGVLRREWINLD